MPILSPFHLQNQSKQETRNNPQLWPEQNCVIFNPIDDSTHHFSFQLKHFSNKKQEVKTKFQELNSRLLSNLQ